MESSIFSVVVVDSVMVDEVEAAAVAGILVELGIHDKTIGVLGKLVGDDVVVVVVVVVVPVVVEDVVDVVVVVVVEVRKLPNCPRTMTAYKIRMIH